MAGCQPAHALTFIGYFTPIRELTSDLLRLQLDGGTLVWVLFFMAATYLNAGWLREKVCVHMLPVFALPECDV